MKVKEKSYLPVSILLLATFIGILIYIYLMQIRVFWQSTVDQITTNTVKHEREIHSWFSQKILIVDIISDDLRYFNLTEVEELENFFTKVVTTNTSVAAAYLGMDNKTIVFNNNQKAPPGYDPTIRTWYVHGNRSRGKTVASEPYMDILTGKLVVTLCKKVQLNNGRNGVVGVDLFLEDITDFINTIHPYSSGNSFLLASNEDIVTHANTKFLPRKTEDATGEAIFSKYNEIETRNVNHIRSSNSNVSIKRLVIENVEKYVATIKIGDVGWIYGCEIPISAFNGDMIRITAPLISTIIIGILISISSIIFNWYHINALKRSKKISETLNKTASIYLSNNENAFEETIAEGITPGADLMGFNRVSVFRNALSEEGLIASQIYCWTKKPGIMQLDPAFTNFHYNNAAKEWKRILANGKSINSPVNELSGKEAELLKASGAISVFATPVFINESFWGFVLYEDHKKKRYFSKDFAEALHSGALLCVNTILRAEMERKIKKIAHTDTLTGILNRLRFMELTSKQIERIKRTGSNSYIVIFDLDFFKAVNDTYGHIIGDRVLKCTAERVNAAIRPYDIFGRYGGEEFIMFISDIDETDVKNLTERIRTAICDTPMVFEDVKLTISASFGAVSALATDNLKDVINIADKALYKAKNDGRNKVVMA